MRILKKPPDFAESLCGAVGAVGAGLGVGLADWPLAGLSVFVVLVGIGHNRGWRWRL